MSITLAQKPIVIPVVITKTAEELLQIAHDEAQWQSRQDYYQNSEY